MNERLNGRRRPHRGNREGERSEGGGEAQYADAEDEESLAGVRGYKTGKRERKREMEEGERERGKREREKERERARMGRRER